VEGSFARKKRNYLQEVPSSGFIGKKKKSVFATAGESLDIKKKQHFPQKERGMQCHREIIGGFQTGNDAQPLRLPVYRWGREVDAYGEKIF